MFIGVIGTRYAGKTTVVDYLKTRGFTVLKLRSSLQGADGLGINDEDTSTAASSDDEVNESHVITRDPTVIPYDRNLGANAGAGPSAQPTVTPTIPSARALDSSADLSGATPGDELDSLDWARSRTPESHVHRDEQKEEHNAASTSSHHAAPSRHPVVSSLRFNTTIEMVDYATKNWRSHFVTEDLPTHDRDAFDPFLKRPFFLLIEVDAPLSVRLGRAGDVTLEQLVEEHDILMYGHHPPLDTPPPASSFHEPQVAFHPTSLPQAAPTTLQHVHMTSISPSCRMSHTSLRKLANLSIINTAQTLEDLWKTLDNLDLTNTERLRPRWDTYFMTLASLASQRSNCMKRRVGAILVRHNRILATGYNGTPRGLTNCNEGGCARCNGKAKSGEALDECLCLHAEENALLEAGRERVGDGDGAVLYCNTCPCLRCSVKIVQTGVKEVVYNFAYSMDAAAADVFSAAGVILRQYTA